MGTNVEEVNNGGEAVGQYYPGSGTSTYRSFIYRHGHFTTFRLRLPDVSPNHVALIYVTARGNLAGYYLDRQRHRHGFLVLHGKAHRIDVPGAPVGRGLGTAVNFLTARGTYCGTVTTGRGGWNRPTNVGFIHRHGQATQILEFRSNGRHDTTPVACTDAGNVLGWYIGDVPYGWRTHAFRATVD